MADALVLTVSGDDQPGVTAGLNTALSHLPVHIKQLEQIVLQGHLVLGVVLTGGNADEYADALATATEFAQARGMTVANRTIPESDLDHWRERIVVTVLGSPLVPSAVAAITATIAAAGGNIDRIRQVAMYPVTAIEFEVGGVPMLALREQLDRKSTRLNSSHT